MAYIPIPSVPSVSFILIPVVGSKIAAKIEKVKRKADEENAKFQAKYKKELDLAAIYQGRPAPNYLSNYAYSTALDIQSAGLSIAQISPYQMEAEIAKIKAEAAAAGNQNPIIDKKQIAERIVKEKAKQLQAQIEMELKKLTNPNILPTGNVLTIPNLPSIPSIPRIPFVL
jgi:hypothetical protein